MKGVDKSNDAKNTPQFTAVGGAKDAAGVGRRGLVNASGKNDVGMTKVANEECRGAERRFPRAITHGFDRAVPEAVRKKGMGRGEVKMLDGPPGGQRQVSDKRLDIVGGGK